MLLKQGMSDFNIKILQSNLKMLGYYLKGIDSVFGDNTEISVKKFQSANGLYVDGIVGPITWLKQINEIKSIQNALNKHGYNLSIDGIAGSDTYNALLKYQEANNLVRDGILGSKTRAALLESNYNSSSNFNISENGIKFIADYEDFYATSYRGLDSQNQTIGYGHVITLGEKFTSLTESEAKALLEKDLQSFVNAVNTMVNGLNLTQSQFDSLISFSYNCGLSALKNSTLLKDIKAGATYQTIKEDFLMWSYCNGKSALGLYRRRYDEFEMYRDGDYTRTYRDFQ